MKQTQQEFRTGTVVMLALSVVFCGLIIAVVFPVIQGDGVPFTTSTPLQASEQQKTSPKTVSPFDHSHDSQLASATLTRPAKTTSPFGEATESEAQQINVRPSGFKDLTIPQANNRERVFESTPAKLQHTVRNSTTNFAPPSTLSAQTSSSVKTLPAGHDIEFFEQSATATATAEDFSKPADIAGVQEIADLMTSTGNPHMVASQLPTGSVYAPITVHPVTLHLDGLLKDQLTILQQRFDESLARQQEQLAKLTELHAARQHKSSEDRKAKRKDRSEQRLREQEQQLKMAEISHGFQRLEQAVDSLEKSTRERLAEISDAAERTEVASRLIQGYQKALEEQETRIATRSQFDSKLKPQRTAEDLASHSNSQEFAPFPRLLESDSANPNPQAMKKQPANITVATNLPAPVDFADDHSDRHLPAPRTSSSVNPFSISIPAQGEEPASVSDVTLFAATADRQEASIQSKIDVAKQPQSPTVEHPLSHQRIYIEPRGQAGRFYPAVPTTQRPSITTPAPKRADPAPRKLTPEIQARDVGFSRTLEFSTQVEEPEQIVIQRPSDVYPVGNVLPSTSSYPPVDNYRYQVSACLSSPGSRTTHREREIAIANRDSVTDLDLDLATQYRSHIRLASATEARPSATQQPIIVPVDQRQSHRRQKQQPTAVAQPEPRTAFRAGRGQNRHVQRSPKRPTFRLQLPSFLNLKRKSTSDQRPTKNAPPIVIRRPAPPVKRSNGQIRTVSATNVVPTHVPASHATHSAVSANRRTINPGEIYQPTWNDGRPNATRHHGESNNKKPGFFSRIKGAFSRIGN